jgi:AraC-like DNA-binding protein
VISDAIDHPGLSSSDLPVRFILFNWFLGIQCLIYMLRTLQIVHRYRMHVKDVFSNLEKIKLDWLQNITLVITAGLIFFIIENALFLFDIKSTQIFDTSSLVAALMFYTLGYMGLIKTQQLNVPFISESINEIEKMTNPKGKYIKSGLNEDDAQEIRQKLLKTMNEDKPFMDSNLTLNSLARLLNVSPHNLSQVINMHLEQNFFDFINEYRLEQVKQDMVDPKKSHLTILAIALEAGFNSKSAFNLIFKKHTGLTPSEYKKSLFPAE